MPLWEQKKIGFGPAVVDGDGSVDQEMLMQSQCVKNVLHFVYFAFPMSGQAQESYPTARHKWIDRAVFVQLRSLPKLKASQISRVDFGTKNKLCFPFRRWLWGIRSFSVVPHFGMCYLHTVYILLFSASVPAPRYYCNLFLWSWCWKSCKNN